MAHAGSVLIVVDDASIRQMLAEYLGSHAFRTTEAADGAAMRVAIEQELPDVVLLDLRLPREDGLSLARYLRERYGVGIIMVTAAGEIIDRVVGLEVGADDYVTKPFDPRELLARPKIVMCRSQTRPAVAPADAPARPRMVPFGRCELELAAHQLFAADGSEFPNTSMEFDLLKEFVEHPGKALSRDRILTLTRNREWEPFDRSIDIRIARLRRKVDADGENPQVIRTVRGVAYMYVPPADSGPAPALFGRCDRRARRRAAHLPHVGVSAVRRRRRGLRGLRHRDPHHRAQAPRGRAFECGAFIATCDLPDPRRLHMSAFYLDG